LLHAAHGSDAGLQRNVHKTRRFLQCPIGARIARDVVDVVAARAMRVARSAMHATPRARRRRKFLHGVVDSRKNRD
jgi:hypothetical protein